MKTAHAADSGAFNPYATPRAAVRDETGAGAQAIFFPVSLLKLSLLSVTMLGLYQVYWFYKNWKCVQRNYGDNVNAPIRAIFYPLVAYTLFKRVREHTEKAGLVTALPVGALAIVLFLFGMTWRLPDPYWFIGFAGFLPLVPVQAAVNELNRKLAPHADENASFSGWNIAGMVFGTLILLLALVGTFLPAE